MYISTGGDLRITVTPFYKEDLSSNHDFFWEYIVRVENTSSSVLQLVGRYWEVICSDGTIQEISGDNIVGQQPILKPGEIFEYTSLANLKTSSGIIKGKYIILSKGEEFDIEVPTFSLDNPYQAISIN